MHYYLIKRLGFLVLTIIAASALAFFMLHAVPGETAENVARHTIVGMEDSVSAEVAQEISSKYNLNDPIWIQYTNWLSGLIFRGDLGSSYVYKDTSVMTLISLALGPTIILAIASMLIVIVVGIPLGMYCAVHENRPSDLIIRGATILSISFPSFWLALMLILVFSLMLNLLPVAGYGSPANIVLPAVALALHPTAVVLRIVRTSMLETLGQQYITFAIAKGLSFGHILWNHAIKNALIPVLTLLGVYFGHLLAGTVIIENIFAWPGIGNLLISSVDARDIPVVTSCIVVIVAMFLIVNFVVDISYHFIDPRIRYE
ncbi:MAG: ABC transporter permease [Methanoregula sp.]|jgi:peptide/nickel transport system permease protein|uniref:ABC transporter permease n=1 Tax=Methanoregula sp. TaxID=2052170 RepID=UPI0025CE4D80|nr:ABC transporter permease [Methanoregula sp.]MCK9632396.1 ABC transporter permease [Methanoregula sp.]